MSKDDSSNKISNHDGRSANLVVAVIVTFEPDIHVFKALIESIKTQVTHIVVVDNSINPVIHSQLPEYGSLIYKSLADNYGIAYAQNFGIEIASQYNPSHILLLDQDSLAAPNMIKLLIAPFKNRPDVIATGPSYIDKRSGKQSFFVMDKHGFPRRLNAPFNHGEEVVNVGFLIASGTLIDFSLFKIVTGMRSDYFIDHVDTEWTLRVREHGYVLLGVPSAVMWHSLGDTVKSVWFFGKRQVSFHSALRDYYMFRNTLLMLRDLRLNIVWRCHFLWRLIQFAAYFLLFVPGRWQRARLMALGLWHGLGGISGKLDPVTGSCSAIPVSVFDPK